MAEALSKAKSLPNLLNYASRQPAILRSSEVILWQGEPQKNEAAFKLDGKASDEAAYFITQRRMVRGQQSNRHEVRGKKVEVQSAKLPALSYSL
jgi:hypothetical protein